MDIRSNIIEINESIRDMKGNDSGTKYAYYKGKNTSNDLL